MDAGVLIPCLITCNFKNASKLSSVIPKFCAHDVQHPQLPPIVARSAVDDHSDDGRCEQAATNHCTDAQSVRLKKIVVVLLFVGWWGGEMFEADL